MINPYAYLSRSIFMILRPVLVLLYICTNGVGFSIAFNTT